MEEAKPCAIEGCTRPRAPQGGRRGRGHYSICYAHMRRKYSCGDLREDVPIRTLAPAGTGTVKYGYRILYLPDHPLAHRDGNVQEHRVVLYDAVGPGAHPCHWCGRSVTWGGDLQVDHVDGHKLNNARENLAPSCSRCNSNRAKAGNPADWSPHTAILGGERSRVDTRSV